MGIFIYREYRAKVLATIHNIILTAVRNFPLVNVTLLSFLSVSKTESHLMLPELA